MSSEEYRGEYVDKLPAGGKSSDELESIVWNNVDGEMEPGEIQPATETDIVTISTGSITDSQGSRDNQHSLSPDSDILTNSNVLPATVVGVDGSVDIIEHPPSQQTEPRSPIRRKPPTPLMIEVPKEIHPINYERNATIPEHTWKRKLSDTFKPLKEFKVTLKHISENSANFMH